MVIYDIWSLLEAPLATLTRSPLSPPAGRRVRRRAETRERLFRAALRLFAERGFFATTVADITEAADVGKGTFFNYFPSKEHVLGAFGEIQVGNVAAALEDAQKGQEPARVILERLMRALAREPGRSQALVRSLMGANLGGAAVREIMLQNLMRGREMIAQLMKIGQGRGEVRRDRDALELARVFQQTFFGTLVMWSMHAPSELVNWLDGTFDLFWRGIEAGPARKSRGRSREERR